MSVVGGDQVGYQYVVLRCVPRVDREEFVNVGVVLYCQSREYLGFAGGVDGDRLRALWPNLDPAPVEAALSTIAAICAGDPVGGPPAGHTLSARFGFLSAPRSTVVQPGPVHGGLVPQAGGAGTKSPEEVLAGLLERYVTVSSAADRG